MDDDLFNDQPQSAGPTAIALAVARVAASTDGQKMFEFLRTHTLERVLDGEATNNQLMHLEGQRFIVKQLLNLAKQGRNEP